MQLLLNLYLGHVLGDFLFQPGKLVQAKREGAAGLAIHAVVIGACTAATLAGRSFSTLWPAAALVTGLHLAIEELTVLAYTRTPTRGLFTFLFDQTLHLLSIGMVVWLCAFYEVPAATTTFGLSIPVPALAWLCGFASVTLAGSILAFEAGNAVVSAEDSKGRLLRLDAPRLGGMLERGAALALTAVHPAAMLAAFVPRLVWAFTRGPEDRKRNLAEGAAGLVLTAAAWAAIYAITYLPKSAGALGRVLF